MALIPYTINKTVPYPLGAAYTARGVKFVGEFDTDARCGVLIYPESSSTPIKIEFPEWSREGRVCAMEIVFDGRDSVSKLLTDKDGRGLRYLFFSGDEVFPDPRMEDSCGFGEFGSVTSPFSRVSNDTSVSSALRQSVPFSKSVFYMLHVRGYTAHKSSKVKDKGTFSGIIQKLPYIKSLGVTGIILMPVYEFNEIICLPDMLKKGDEPSGMVNFWGYNDGYYFVPKYSFSAKGNPVREMHEMVNAMHDAGIEVILQFKFPSRFSSRDITDVLRFWRTRYDVDGFQLIGGGLPINDIMTDPIVYGCKILCDDALTRNDDLFNPEHGHMDLGFMTDIRKFLKGDPNSAQSAAYQLRDSDPVTNPIVFIARQDTMRAFDIVSYNEKHNLDNGENGIDGADYNYSWNCGIEGVTRKKAITELRKRQLKNAFAMTLLSQGTPLIYGGDEFGNTQFGNNNPYNQDNDTGYIKWPTGSFGTEILDFVKSLIAIRKDHPAVGCDHKLMGRDYLSYGYPDISMHGEELWRADIGPTSHSFGILYYDKYADESDERLLYLIYNMHWETKNIALPKLKNKMEWKVALTTDDTNLIDSTRIVMNPRSFTLLETYVR
ncbi:MAG: hypothetical protein K6G12_04295 [Lachnospiraceae bacterium]|nr:hypothetical protein [Lachnospiraceae bacterium]